ncbi:MAG: adenosylmethionine decarboxylase [Pyrinomonadaceae bacterium]
MAIVGTEWLIDASGCRAESLRDTQLLRAMFERIIRELNLRVVGEPVWHKFAEPSGVTGMVLLTESHLTCHTYPEHELATINLYCCKARPAWNWAENLREMLGATSVKVRIVERCGTAASPVDAASVLPENSGAANSYEGERR